MRERPLPEPAGIDLCASNELAERGGAHVFDLVWRGETVRGFVLRIEGEVVGYLNRCVHVPAEMDWQPGQFLDISRQWIVCSLHGAHYEPRDGRCVAGPCGRGALTPLSVAEAEGRVRWYPSPEMSPVEFR